MALTNAYTTLNAVKSALRIADNVDDTLIEYAINTASRMIDGFCQREFYNAGTATRVYAATDELWVDIDDLAGTAITVQTDPNADGSWSITWAATDYQLEPLNGKLAGQTWPYTRLRAAQNYLFPVESELALVRVVNGVWGWPAVPQAIEYATIMQSQRLFKRLDSPTGVIGFGDMGAVRVSRQLDPDIADMVYPYKREGFGVG
jgi:hypothetical protein